MAGGSAALQALAGGSLSLRRGGRERSERSSTSHLEFRLKKRGIPYDIPKRIYRDSNERYYDNIAGHKIAVSRLDYSGREREVMIAYDEFEGWIDPIQSGGVVFILDRIQEMV
jgi:hypothetical protein